MGNVNNKRVNVPVSFSIAGTENARRKMEAHNNDKS